MKKVLIALLLSLDIMLFSQLLVVQVNKKGTISPLSKDLVRDKGDQVVNVLLNYTWPSCIAYDLTEEEKKELLSPVKGTEQKFVRKKLKAIDSRLDVVLFQQLYTNFFMLMST